MRTGFCVSGRGSLFRAAVVAGDITPALLITEKKASPDLDDFAAAHGIPHVRLDPGDRAAFDAAVTRTLVDANLDLVALTFDRIVAPDAVAHYTHRMINVHPGLLPAFPGMKAIDRALAAGVRFAGATVHEVINDVDAGPVIAQAVVGTIPGESHDDYGRRMYAALEPMFLAVLRWYAEGRVGHDESGRIVVRGARYGTLPVSPEPSS